MSHTYTQELWSSLFFIFSSLLSLMPLLWSSSFPFKTNQDCVAKIVWYFICDFATIRTCFSVDDSFFFAACRFISPFSFEIASTSAHSHRMLRCSSSRTIFNLNYMCPRIYAVRGAMLIARPAFTVHLLCLNKLWMARKENDYYYSYNKNKEK